MLMNGPPPEICLAGGYGIRVLVMLMNGPPPEICLAGGYGITMYLLC